MKKKLILILLVLLLAYFFLPMLIHKIYRSNTEDKDIATNRNLYNTIADDINANKGNYDASKKESLDSLYLWFQVRGIAIDEDHIPKTTNENWQEIIQYWSNN